MNVKIRNIVNNGIENPEPKGADYATLNPHQPLLYEGGCKPDRVEGEVQRMR